MPSNPRPNRCDSFTRSQAVRRVLATGKRPIPREWDPRMPIPAGVGIDRRRFLAGAAGGLISCTAPSASVSPTGCSATGSRARRRCSRPQPDPRLDLRPGRPRRPLAAGAGRRPAVREAAPVAGGAGERGVQLREDPRLYWHPSAASIATLHNAGKVTVFPSIGYTDPDMSHFTSRHYWEVGATDASLLTGWMGRYLDLAGSSDNPFQGLSMDGAMNPTLATATAPTAAIDQPDNFNLYMNGLWGDGFEWSLEALTELGDVQRRSTDPAIAQAAQAASEVGAVRRTLKPWSKRPRPALAHTVQDHLSPGAVGDVGGRQIDHQKTAVGVDRDVALATHDLLARVVSPYFSFLKL